MGVEIVAGRRTVGKMTGNEAKAIRWIKSIKDSAVVTLDHIKRNEPNVSPMLYEGRKEKAETIIKGFEELEQYRAVGTVEGCRAYKGIAEKEFSNGCLDLEIIEELNKYRHIGTPGECREAMERQRARKTELWGDGCDDEGKIITICTTAQTAERAMKSNTKNMATARTAARESCGNQRKGDEDTGGFMFQDTERSWCGLDALGAGGIYKDYRIIGNVFDNPELGKGE